MCDAPAYNGPFDRALLRRFAPTAVSLIEDGGARVQCKRKGGAWVLVQVEGARAAFLFCLRRSRWYAATEAEALANDVHAALTARVLTP